MGELRVTGDSEQISVYFIDGLAQQIETELNKYIYYYKDEGDFEIYGKSGYVLESVTLDGVSMPIDTEKNSSKFHVVFNIFGVNDIVVISKGNQPPKNVSGFNYLYSVDKTILKSIASERFITGGDSTTDLGTYIINVLEMPFSISDEIKGSENPIILGNRQLTTKAVELIEDEMIIDLGVIIVPNKFNNSYDFMNTVTRLHLPFTNVIELDINYVIGYEINVKYIIDLYYGDVTINVSSSKIDNIIHSETTKIGRDIPFIRKYSGEAVNSISTKNEVNNGLLKPFIEVVRNIPYEQGNIFKNEVITHEELKNVTGFITVNNIILNSSATQNEKTTITNLLRSGVYIK